LAQVVQAEPNDMEMIAQALQVHLEAIQLPVLQLEPHGPLKAATAALAARRALEPLALVAQIANCFSLN
jgi:hypothetical protein